MRQGQTILKDWQQGKWLFDLGWLWRASMQTVPRTVCEVGIGPQHLSIIPQFAQPLSTKMYEHGRIAGCDRIIGIEPNPEFQQWPGRIRGVSVYKAAIAEKQGKAELCLNGGSSYLKGAL